MTEMLMGKSGLNGRMLPVLNGRSVTPWNDGLQGPQEGGQGEVGTMDSSACRLVEQRRYGTRSVLQVPLRAGAPASSVKTLVYQPGDAGCDAPVVMVMHGVTRDAWMYMESWVGLAERYGFVLVVPEFPRDDWPTSRQYNLGNVRTRAGEDLNKAAWTFTAVDTVFDAVRRHCALSTSKFHLYGHSAGAQFVHRYVLHTGGARVAAAAAANAGWYLTPDRGAKFPYGIADVDLDADTLSAALATPMTVLLGERDCDPDSPDLRRTRRAERQGPHRLARGRYFMEVATGVALAMGCDLTWRLRVIRNVGHSDRAMAPFACAALLGHRAPSG